MVEPVSILLLAMTPVVLRSLLPGCTSWEGKGLRAWEEEDQGTREAQGRGPCKEREQWEQGGERCCRECSAACYTPCCVTCSNDGVWRRTGGPRRNRGGADEGRHNRLASKLLCSVPVQTAGAGDKRWDRAKELGWREQTEQGTRTTPRRVGWGTEYGALQARGWHEGSHV